jgi:hypothetical protein
MQGAKPEPGTPSTSSAARQFSLRSVMLAITIVCMMLAAARLDEARWPLHDQVFSLLAMGALGAWLGGALHAGKLGYNRTALIAVLGLFGWFNYLLMSVWAACYNSRQHRSPSEETPS